MNWFRNTSPAVRSYLNKFKSSLEPVHSYKKGDRAIVNLGSSKRPEFWVGSVLGIKKGKVHVKFDNGKLKKFKQTQSLKGLVGKSKNKKKSKSPIDERDLEAWVDTKIDKRVAAKIKARKLLCFKWFEKYLFGDQFNYPEKNTPDEQRLWQILLQYVELGGTGTKDEIRAFKRLRSCQKYFEHLLTPKEKFMYRGTKLKKEVAAALLKNKHKLIKSDAAPEDGMVVLRGTYIPSSELQSWTNSFAVATQFTSNGYMPIVYNDEIFDMEQESEEYYEGRVPCVVKCKTNATFFGSPEFTDRIQDEAGEGSSYDSEKEVFRIGKRIRSKFLIPKRAIKELL